MSQTNHGKALKNKPIFIATVFAVFALSALAGYFGPPYMEAWKQEREKKAFTPAPVAAEIAEAFSAEFSRMSAATEPDRLPDVPFYGVDGAEYKMSDFKGQPVLVNFWATWCAPCVVELPSLQKLADHYEGRLKLVGIALELQPDPSKIKSFLEKREVGDFAAYYDKNSAFMEKLALKGLPTSFLIGSDGLILYRFEGDADWASGKSKAFFDHLLSQTQ